MATKVCVAFCSVSMAKTARTISVTAIAARTIAGCCRCRSGDSSPTHRRGGRSSAPPPSPPSPRATLWPAVSRPEAAGPNRSGTRRSAPFSSYLGEAARPAFCSSVGPALAQARGALGAAALRVRALPRRRTGSRRSDARRAGRTCPAAGPTPLNVPPPRAAPGGGARIWVSRISCHLVTELLLVTGSASLLRRTSSGRAARAREGWGRVGVSRRGRARRRVPRLRRSR